MKRTVCNVAKPHNGRWLVLAWNGVLATLPAMACAAAATRGTCDLYRGIMSVPGNYVLVLLGTTNIQGPIMSPSKHLIATYAGPQYIQ